MKKNLLFLAFSIAITTLYAQTDFSDKMLISNTAAAPYTIAAGLVDGDTFNDIVVGTFLGGTLEYYKNNGDKTFADSVLITNTLDGVGGLELVDLNNDGLLDLLASSYNGDTVAWYPNDGNGNFTTENIISNTVMGASGIFVGTIDAGDTPDVAVTAYDSNEVVWFANDGAGNFSGPSLIDNTLTAPGVVKLRDLDGDGDLDALIATGEYNSNNSVYIYINDLVPGGTVSYDQVPSPVTSGKKFLFNASFEDLDGDSNLDILLTELDITPGGGACYWYEYNGTGYTETEFTTSIENPSVAQVKDLDDDGLADIILSNGNAGNGVDLVWFKNNGGGSFDPEQVIDATQSQVYVYAVVDLDNDNDLDIASCAYNDSQLNWFENEKYTLGNLNFDGDTIKFYPNPVQNKLYYHTNENDSVTVAIYDVLGKKVMETHVSPLQALNVSELKSGIYLLKVLGKDVTYKFVKN